MARAQHKLEEEFRAFLSIVDALDPYNELHRMGGPDGPGRRYAAYSSRTRTILAYMNEYADFMSSAWADLLQPGTRHFFVAHKDHGLTFDNDQDVLRYVQAKRAEIVDVVRKAWPLLTREVKVGLEKPLRMFFAALRRAEEKLIWHGFEVL
jgi:hypothetical protein